MARVYYGQEKMMLCWDDEWIGTVKGRRPAFKAAKQADLTWWPFDDSDAGTVSDLLGLWLQVSGLAVTRVGNWNVVIDDRMKDGRVIGLLMTVLFGRAEDEWLVARYEGSSDLLDWGHLNADGQMLVEMLEIAKRTSVRWTTVWILCTRISSLMLHRPQRLRDAFAWKEELARRKLSAS